MRGEWVVSCRDSVVLTPHSPREGKKSESLFLRIVENLIFSFFLYFIFPYFQCLFCESEAEDYLLGSGASEDIQSTKRSDPAYRRSFSPKWVEGKTLWRNGVEVLTSYWVCHLGMFSVLAVGVQRKHWIEQEKSEFNESVGHGHVHKCHVGKWCPVTSHAVVTSCSAFKSEQILSLDISAQSRFCVLFRGGARWTHRASEWAWLRLSLLTSLGNGLWQSSNIK